MFDWISISTNSRETQITTKELLKRENIALISKISNWGEILYNGESSATYKDIKIKMYNNQITKYMFSVHKLYNELHNIKNRRNEAMNHDRFDFSKMHYIINWLKENFNINPKLTHIHQLEFGFNLTDLPINTQTILKHIISFKGKQFNQMKVIGAGFGLDITYNKFYRLKFYDKALQNGLDYPILRLEYKALKIQPIKHLFNNNTTILTLLDPLFCINCKEHIIKHIELCIITDNLDINEYPFLKKLKIKDWHNPLFWYECTPVKRSIQKKEFEKFIKERGVLHLKKSIINSINKEFITMATYQNYNVFT